MMMVMMRYLMLVMVVLNWGFVKCEKPKIVNVGAVFAFNSVIGRVAKPAMEAALADINLNSNILNGIEMRLLFEDTECNVFLGSIQGISHASCP